MQPDALLAFVIARLDEDEAAAREGADGDSGQWFTGRKWNVYRAEDEARYDEDYQGEENRLVVYGNVKPQSEHVARHDPARVLREVEAKRAMVRRYELGLRAWIPDAEAWFSPAAEMFASDTEWLIRTLAAVYSGHPDYDPEWKP